MVKDNTFTEMALCCGSPKTSRTSGTNRESFSLARVPSLVCRGQMGSLVLNRVNHFDHHLRFKVPKLYLFLTEHVFSFHPLNQTKGFAVAFDTYKNAEMGSTHKDIYLLTNDGSSELDIHSPLAGCTANYRWFEKREDFSVRDYAIARVSYNSGTNKLRVEIDGANTHRFVECFDTELPHGQFIAGAHIAFSATTGQLADNHDILAVDTASYGTEITSDDEEQHYFLRDIGPPSMHLFICCVEVY